MVDRFSFSNYEVGDAIYYGCYGSSYGDLVLFTTGGGICGLHFLDNSVEDYVDLMHKKFSMMPISCPEMVNVWWEKFQSGDKVGVALHGTPFERRVWHELCCIPKGETRCYTDVAKKMGCPKSVRGVAHACSAISRCRVASVAAANTLA